MFAVLRVNYDSDAVARVAERSVVVGSLCAFNHVDDVVHMVPHVFNSVGGSSQLGVLYRNIQLSLEVGHDPNAGTRRPIRQQVPDVGNTVQRDGVTESHITRRARVIVWDRLYGNYERIEPGYKVLASVPFRSATEGVRDGSVDGDRHNADAHLRFSIIGYQPALIGSAFCGRSNASHRSRDAIAKGLIIPYDRCTCSCWRICRNQHGLWWCLSLHSYRHG